LELSGWNKEVRTKRFEQSDWLELRGWNKKVETKRLKLEVATKRFVPLVGTMKLELRGWN